jgi:hypothetical protein
MSKDKMLEKLNEAQKEHDIINQVSLRVMSLGDESKSLLDRISNHDFAGCDKKKLIQLIMRLTSS